VYEMDQVHRELPERLSNVEMAQPKETSKRGAPERAKAQGKALDSQTVQILRILRSSPDQSRPDL